MSSNKESKENEQIGASYLSSFYVNIQYLTEWASSYLNLLIELQAKYGTNFQEMDEEERVKIISHLQNVRHFSTLCHFQYNSVMITLKKRKINKEERITELYKEMMNKEKTMISGETIREYTQLYHDFLANTSIDELMTTSRDLLNELTKGDN